MELIRIENIDKIDVAARSFIEKMGQHKIFAFYGQMGAGKTTFIKAVCKELGVEENITSPSFALINEYSSTKSGSIYHFDCYRLKDSEEAFDIGAEEYFYSGNLCFIEWPERIEDLLPENTVEVQVTVADDQSRVIEI
ncbi:MAG: tRNA (adenosine(37)-N6)-threonylcarbamoyltransferase complex ATPase subunit type 1 TsaE [Prolixibacteraceae bacterium]|jgi:tRNA threonylcarbamoyladenosine biosynthesis protein TsaE|nr:tRNA (adenosine(37)-N6)-threonylcarbamoyltransferase complex ATPase subunit type 1 TsaE [Prolixibacteraceae bacterium]